MVADPLSRMPEIESLSFTELQSAFLDSLQGKYEQDPTYSFVWQAVLRRDPSPQPSINDVAVQAMRIPHKHLGLRAMRCVDGKKFPLTGAIYSIKDEYVCPRTMTSGAKFYTNVMIVLMQVILE